MLRFVKKTRTVINIKLTTGKAEFIFDTGKVSEWPW